jgi:hypothetical protein
MPFNLDPSNPPLPEHLPVVHAVETWLRHLAPPGRLPEVIDLDFPLYDAFPKDGYGLSRMQARMEVALLDRLVRRDAAYNRSRGRITYLQIRGAKPNGAPAVNTARDLINVCC